MSSEFKKLFESAREFAEKNKPITQSDVNIYLYKKIEILEASNSYKSGIIEGLMIRIDKLEKKEVNND